MRGRGREKRGVGGWWGWCLKQKEEEKTLKTFSLFFFRFFFSICFLELLVLTMMKVVGALSLKSRREETKKQPSEK